VCQDTDNRKFTILLPIILSYICPSFAYKNNKKKLKRVTKGIKNIPISASSI
jgi:hypothetical protein